MAIIKRGNKYSVVLPMGLDPKTDQRKQKWFSGYSSEQEAKKAERSILNDMDKGIWVEPSKLTLHSFLKDTWLPKRKLKPATILNYEYFIGRLEKHATGQMKLQKIQPLHMEDYMEYLYNQGLSPTSVRHEMSMIKGALKWAVDKDLLVKSPARTLKLPERNEFKPHFINAEELENMIEIATEKDQPIDMPIRLAGTCGLRNAEVAGLRWSNVNFQEKYIYIEIALDYVDIPEDDEENQKIDDTEDSEKPKKRKLGFVDLKTVNSDRCVPLSDDTLAALEKLKTNQEAVLKANKWTNPLDLVNIQLENEAKPYSPDYIDRRFSKFLSKNGLPTMRFHDLRHSFATILRDAGVSMETISELLGHYDSSFTHKVYAHPTQDIHRKAIDKFQKRIDKTKPQEKEKPKIIGRKIKKISAAAVKTTPNTANNLLIN